MHQRMPEGAWYALVSDARWVRLMMGSPPDRFLLSCCVSRFPGLFLCTMARIPTRHVATFVLGRDQCMHAVRTVVLVVLHGLGVTFISKTGPLSLGRSIKSHMLTGAPKHRRSQGCGNILLKKTFSRYALYRSQGDRLGRCSSSEHPPLWEGPPPPEHTSNLPVVIET